MKQLVQALLISITVSGCSVESTTDSVDIAKARKLATAKLLDPDSALFRELKVIRERSEDRQSQSKETSAAEPDVFVCGEINTKNSYGGYTGYRRFVARINNGYIFTDLGIGNAEARMESAKKRQAILLEGAKRYTALTREFVAVTDEILELHSQVMFDRQWRSTCQ